MEAKIWVPTQKIHPTSTVEIHFEIRLEDGSIADSTYDNQQPCRFKMGRGVFSEAFEEALIGLTPKTRKDILLTPEHAFGERHPAKVYQVPRNRFGNAPVGALEEGLILAFRQPDGSELPGVIRAINEQEVTVDFNHPLAGFVVLFKVEVVSVVS